MGNEKDRREQLEELSEEEKIELIVEQEKKNKELQERIEKLERAIEQLKGSGVSGPAPFRRRDKRKKRRRKKPGRDDGHEGEYKSSPEPDEVDETIEVRLDECPKCGEDSIARREARQQYIIEIPEPTCQVTELITEKGTCHRCGSVETTHPLQTSTATGAAKTQYGPRAKALAVELHQTRGLSLGATTEILDECFGVSISPGAISQMESRAAAKLEDSYETIQSNLRQSRSVYADETGWWVSWAGGRRWLWSFSSQDWSLYRVDRRRNSQVVSEVLTPDFDGVLVSDCLAAYDKLTCQKQKCYSHHLKALSRYEKQGENNDLIPKLKERLKQAIELDKWWDTLDESHRESALQQLRIKMACLLQESGANEYERKATNRLEKRFEHLFTFIGKDGVEATNNQAERELRPAVINRKISGGNKTENGARSWEILKSVEQTLARQDRNFTRFLADTLRYCGRSPPSIEPN